MERTRTSRLWSPVVWPLAVLWLALQGAGSAAGRSLDAYDRRVNAAFRAAARAGRAVLRALGPLGRALRRLAAPLLRLLRRVWDAVSVWLMTRMFRPLGRAARWVVAPVRRAVASLRATVSGA